MGIIDFNPIYNITVNMTVDRSINGTVNNTSVPEEENISPNKKTGKSIQTEHASVTFSAEAIAALEALGESSGDK